MCLFIPAKNINQWLKMMQKMEWVDVFLDWCWHLGKLINVWREIVSSYFLLPSKVGLGV
jgi:hypothetical protein